MNLKKYVDPDAEKSSIPSDCTLDWIGSKERNWVLDEVENAVVECWMNWRVKTRCFVILPPHSPI
jgi:hypothetical protein